MKVFLTGGTGYLGDHVGRALLEAGHDVTALIRDPGKAGDLVSRGAVLLQGDLLQVEEWGPTLSGVDAVVHVAGMVESWNPDPRRFDRVNVQGTLDLVATARQAGVGRILVTGSLFALGDSTPDAPRDEESLSRAPSSLQRANDYVRTKTDVGRRLRERQHAGDPIIGLYPTILLGPGKRTAGNHTARVLEEVGNGTLPGLVGNGEQTWNLVSVESVARGYGLALEKGTVGENYILGGEHWTQRRLVERAAEVFGVRPPTRRLGTRLPLVLGGMAEWWAGLTGRAPFLTRAEVRLYDAHWVFTSEKAKRDLGYQAEPVEVTIRKTVKWLQEGDAVS